jgi:protein sprouty family protein 2
MDRRNGVFNHLAPPRPPKSIPRVHRPRAPDPGADAVDSPFDSSLAAAAAASSSIHIISSAHPLSQAPPIPPQSVSSNSQAPAAAAAHSRMNSNSSNHNSSSSSINSSSTTSISHHRAIPSIPPVTAPLTPLQSGRSPSAGGAQSSVSTFSRRRTEMTTTTGTPTTIGGGSSSSSSNINVNSVTRSLTPSSLVAPTANLIQNAINAVVRRSTSPVNISSSGSSSNNNNSNSVTLQIPRPENERLPNEYVDTPFTSQNGGKLLLTTPGSRHSLATSTVPSRSQQQQQQQLLLLNSTGHTNISIIDGTSVLNNNNNNNININSNINNISNSNSNKVTLPNRTVQRPNLLPITKQPSFRSTNTLSKKDASMLLHQPFSHCPEESINAQNAANNNGGSGLIMNAASDQLNSITCPQCNRCRCEECQRPRQLPYKWICNDNFLCSAETIIDYASCLCCVKGLYYHCAKDHELDCDSDTIRCAEDPCSCAPYKRVSRWGCLSALSLLLPCLLCYWPMRGCVGLCAKCYAKHSRHGCRCNNASSANNSRLNIINLASSPGQDQISTHHYHRQSNNINDLTPEKRLLDSTHHEY